MYEVCRLNSCATLEKKIRLFRSIKSELIFLEDNCIMFFCSTFFQVPDTTTINHLPDRLLLFRHDYNSNNILQMISSPSEIVDETLVEIVLTANRKLRLSTKTHFLIFLFTNSCRLQCS